MVRWFLVLVAVFASLACSDVLKPVVEPPCEEACPCVDISECATPGHVCLGGVCLPGECTDGLDCQGPGTCQSAVGAACEDGFCRYRAVTTGACCVAETAPDFCNRLGKNCGTVDATDNCGNLRSEVCGSCSGSTCTNNVCTCVPETDAGLCARLQKDCGMLTAWDLCGTQRTVDCGVCAGTCSDNVCFSMCMPTTTCLGEGAECDAIDNGCATVLCGTCQGTDTCNPTSKQCDPCVPTTNCTMEGAECGSVFDGCQQQTCGPCMGNTACEPTSQICECVPITDCATEGAECYQVWDGCQNIPCGPCTSPQTCNTMTKLCEGPPPEPPTTQLWDFDIECSVGTNSNCNSCSETCPFISSATKPWTCTFTMNVTETDTYHVWVYQRQNYRNDQPPGAEYVAAIDIDIDGNAYVAGDQEMCSPCWAWEELGVLSLSAGAHSVTVSDNAPSIGAWWLGTLMITTHSGPVSSCNP